MKLVILFGPHAVGKMTVGQELAKATGLKLFHNHMTMDIVLDLFENSPNERRRLVDLFRHEIFNAYCKTDEYGMIFTFMWSLDSQSDWDYINNLEAMFAQQGAQVYYVELAADFDRRIERNKTENRLYHKPSKRNLEASERIFRRLESEHRLNSYDGEITKEHYIKINNDDLQPDVVAAIIKERFNL